MCATQVAKEAKASIGSSRRVSLPPVCRLCIPFMHTAYMRHLAHAWRTLKLISYSLALCLWRSCYLMAALGMGTESKQLYYLHPRGFCESVRSLWHALCRDHFVLVGLDWSPHRVRFCALLHSGLLVRLGLCRVVSCVRYGADLQSRLCVCCVPCEAVRSCSHLLCYCTGRFPPFGSVLTGLGRSLLAGLVIHRVSCDHRPNITVCK